MQTIAAIVFVALVLLAAYYHEQMEKYKKIALNLQSEKEYLLIEIMRLNNENIELKTGKKPK